MWAYIRGGTLGIGPQRQDFYTSFLAMHSQPRQQDTTLADFSMPWISTEPEAEDSDED
jgi:hypothetical protein